VPQGAFVCRGCQAEIQYGPPVSAYLAALIGSVFIGLCTGVVTANILPNALSFLYVIVGVGVFIGLLIKFLGAIGRKYKDRVYFKRYYRT
jgi:hypothetical protein